MGRFYIIYKIMQYSKPVTVEDVHKAWREIKPIVIIGDSFNKAVNIAICDYLRRKGIL